MATTLVGRSVAVETKLGWRSVPVVTKMGWKSDHKKSKICNFEKFGNFLELFIDVLLISMSNYIGRVIFASSATLPLRYEKNEKLCWQAYSLNMMYLQDQ